MPPTAGQERRKLIIDTDAGVDDAHAILLALQQPTVEVLALTTVDGNAQKDQVGKNVLRVLQAANRLDVPVYPGCDRPLLGRIVESAEYHGKDGLGDVPDPNVPSTSLLQTKHAAQAIVDIVNAHPGEVTLVCLAPLTNIALALRLDPSLPSKLQRCGIMGGNIHGKGNHSIGGEFNFLYDAGAAHVVMREMTCDTFIVPWEACVDSAMTWEDLAAVRAEGGPLNSLMSRIEEHSRRFSLAQDWPYLMCDEWVAAVVADPDIVVDSKLLAVDIETEGRLSRGMMLVDWDDRFLKGTHKKTIVSKLNTEKVIALLKASFKPSE